MRDAFAPTGIVVSQRSSEEYQLAPPGAEQACTALYLLLAVPQHITTDQVYTLLTAQLATWPHPVTFRGLLTELEQHQRWAEAMELD